MCFALAVARDCQRCFHPRVDGAADDPVGVRVLDRAQIQLALGGGVFGDVGQPGAPAGPPETAGPEMLHPWRLAAYQLPQLARDSSPLGPEVTGGPIVRSMLAHSLHA